MTFLEHLEELRRTLLHVVAAMVVGAIVCWAFSGTVLTWLIGNTSGEAIFIRPTGAFLARLKVALVLGLLVTLPYSFYRIWSFVAPGLLARERRMVLPASLVSVALFYGGIAFAYFALVPLMVPVLMGFGTGNLRAQTDIQFLLDLVFTMGLACGLIFQLPLFAGFFAWVGMLTPAFLRRTWRHAIVLMFVVAALLTPADPLSQLLLVIPLLVLYGMCLGLTSVIHRRRGAKTSAEDA